MKSIPHVENIINSTKDNLKQNFIKNIYRYIHSDYQNIISEKELRIISDYSYEHFYNFKSKREIHHKILKDKSDSTLFSIHGQNMPFLFDTVKNLMDEIGINFKYIFHPILNVSRDTHGNLLNFSNKAEYNEESFIVLYFDHKLSSEYSGFITTKIREALDQADIINNSWQPILSSIDHTTKKLTELSLEQNNAEILNTKEFLKWLKDGNFTFIASCEMHSGEDSFQNMIGYTEIFKNEEVRTNFLNTNESTKEIIEFGKINITSNIYKNYYYDFIKINLIDKDGALINSRIIIGVFSYSIDFQSVLEIPIIKQKYDYVTVKSSFHDKGYNAKKTRIIIESIPRVALFHISSEQLSYLVSEVLSSMLVGNVKLFNVGKCVQNFVETIIFLPRTKFSPSNHLKIQEYLKNRFEVKHINDFISELGQEFIFMHSTLITENCVLINDHEIKKIENDLEEILSNWMLDTTNLIRSKNLPPRTEKEYLLILSTLSENYQLNSSPENTLDDIENLIKLYDSNKILYDLVNNDGDIFLKIYSRVGKLTISDTTPILENLGFSVIDEKSYEIHQQKDNVIHVYQLKPKEDLHDFDKIKLLVIEKLNAIFDGKTISDEFSNLVTYASINWREIDLLRSFANYMHQINYLYDYKYVSSTLIKHFEFTRKFIKLFEAKFHPKLKNKKSSNEIYKYLEEYIQNVENSAQDKVLSALLRIINAVLRTNFYQEINNEPKKYISLKFNSSKVPDIAKPIPFAEIFVYSSEFEGIHLRGARVARGGLRWSDREEDYRTEVFGLMKAQMTKNTVIVPEGSKGGFYTKFSADDMPREEYLNRAIECYKNFLRGLLDITDNIIGNTIEHPKNTICLDDNDPYLVVAADKGTATFSDYANEVSNEYGFWLGDAFASGGSAGYDHKKMAITAKGAWLSVQRHFKEIGVDVQQDEITVVGIGDMSGDVFGNGMLLSKAIKLVAAFNHMHIFIDPNPNALESYKERKRLFNLPRSRWTDYNESLISKGGGIFSRDSKEIKLTPEIQKLLDVNDIALTPDKLINVILKAEVDLIWNGGIGTYIKSSNEHNQQIGDKANDILRVNAEDVRAKSFGEGGNLGASQLGRIELAQKGGMLNTDFIDNSAGVDCSDHEVNMKIALGKAIESKKISLEQRNEILSSMTNDVTKHVLVDNQYQTLAISFMERSSIFTMESFTKLIDTLEEEKYLQREVEFLPNNKVLMQRSNDGLKLTRPELSVILSYSKMMVNNKLIDSMISTDEFFERWLLEYFPKEMRVKFKDEIIAHPLRKEIILTILTNKMVNQISGPIINSLLQDTGAHLCDLARGFVIVEEIFDIDKIWQEVDELNEDIPDEKKIEIYTDLNKVLRRGITWIINNLEHPLNIKESIKKYQDITIKVADLLSTNLIGTDKEKYEFKLSEYKKAGIPNKLAQKSAKLETLVSSFDIAHICIDTGADIESVCKSYFLIASSFSIDWLRRSSDKLMNESYWLRLSLQSMKDDLYDKQRRILRKIVSEEMHTKPSKWIEKNKQNSFIFNSFMENIKKQETIDINMLIIANKKLEMFIRKS